MDENIKSMKFNCTGHITFDKFGHSQPILDQKKNFVFSAKSTD